MLKRNNKAIAVVIALVFCLSFIIPGFVSPDNVQAAQQYQVIQSQTINKTAGAANMGVVKVTLPDMAIAAGSVVTVSLPSDVTLPAAVPVVAAHTANTFEIVAPGGADGMVAGDFAAAGFATKANNTFDIELNAPLVTAGANKYFYIYFEGITMNNMVGDFKVTFLPPANSAFEQAMDILVGKVTSEGTTVTNIKKVKEITTSGGTIDVVSIMETAPGVLDTGGTINAKIVTKGYSFNTAAATDAVVFAWDFGGLIPAAPPVPADTVMIGAGMFVGPDNKELNFDLSTAAPAIARAPGNTSGRISFGNLSIVVDDSVAKPGDEIEIRFKGADMTEQTITVAKLVDFSAKVVEGTKKDLYAGKKEQKLGEFSIEEGAASSLVAGRTILITLPEGLEWDTTAGGIAYNQANNLSVINNSTITLSGSSTVAGVNWVVNNNDPKTLKMFVQAASPAGGEGAKIKFKDMKINVSPKFSGPINITVGGTAGVSGEVTVGEVKPLVEMKVADLKDAIIGLQSQSVGDLTIAETKADNLVRDIIPPRTTADGDKIYLQLDSGVTWATTPTVKVVEGDLEIKTKDVVKNGRLLTIPIKITSTKTPAKIEISNIKVTLDRTVPEGAAKVKLVEGNNALNECTGLFVNDSAGSIELFKCITPAPGEGTEGSAAGQFKIDSNIYQLNGVSKVMDVAPYIKSGRTYVPVRYLAYALGVVEADVVWDEASQKVTLTKGDNVVEMTIGQTTITVNGEAQTMDVAPEITDGRTMLPARYVAEGLGYIVGWDPGTRTVLISK